MKTLYLINPSSGTTFSGLSECLDVFGRRCLCPNLALPSLAALVDKRNFNVVICDENVEAIDYDFPCDCVGLTVHQYQKVRAFQIAEIFKKRGKLVIMGGPYITLNPVDKYLHVDVIFRGEAENTFPQFLSDYLQDRYKPIYQETGPINIAAQPPPRLDLLRNNHYLTGIMQISRGCPYKCEFCDSIALMGRKMRYKNNGQITAELNQLHRLGYRNIFIADDNFTADKHRVKEILMLLRDWNMTQSEPFMFTTNISIDIAQHPELIQLLSEALVLNVFVGIESPNADSLVEAGKLQNLDDRIIKGIQLLHQSGIDVSAGMIVGFDHDTPGIFQTQVDYIMNAHIPICFAGMLLAPEGTSLKERLIREGRYIDTELPGDHTFDSNIIPKQMSLAELRGGYFWLMNQLYDEQNFIKRVKDLLPLFPKPHPLQLRLKSRENKKRRHFFSIFTRLAIYYMSNGKALRRIFRQMFHLLFKYRCHAEMIIYWFIVYKHFRRILIRHGVWKQKYTTPDIWSHDIRLDDIRREQKLT